MNWILFLDDVRHPLDVLSSKELLKFSDEQQTLIWAKDLDQAKWYLENLGLPDLMLLDHDLGGEATTMQLLHWMRDVGMCDGYFIPAWRVHSSNPVGAANIEAFMRSWNRSVR